MAKGKIKDNNIKKINSSLQFIAVSLKGKNYLEDLCFLW